METGTAVSRPLGKVNPPKQELKIPYENTPNIKKNIHKITIATIY